jgi:hypothetical protein
MSLNIREYCQVHIKISLLGFMGSAICLRQRGGVYDIFFVIHDSFCGLFQIGRAQRLQTLFCEAHGKEAR